MKDEPIKNQNEMRMARIIVNLNKEEFEFIDKIGRDAFFSTGKRLTNNKILRAFINAMREIGINGEGLYSAEELKNRILVKTGFKQDRRRYQRFKTGIMLAWRKLESMDTGGICVSKDISESGFRINLEKEQNVGEIFEFNIKDPKEPKKSITVYGRIAWVKKRDKEGDLEAGVELTYISDEDKDRFKRLFDDSARNEVSQKKE